MKNPMRLLLILKAITPYFFLFVLLLTSSLTYAQNLVYAKGLQNRVPLGGSIVGQSIVVDNVGNTYVAGTFFNTADFDPGPGRADLTSNVNTLDIFIAKYNASGNYQYVKRLGGLQDDFVADIAIDGTGNVYITGNFSGTADFDPGTGTVALTSAGEADIFIARYDASGNYVYAKALGSTGSDNGHGIAVDGSGNI